MLTSTNIWMSALGLVYLVTGIIVRRRELTAARGLDKFIALGPVFIAASLAAFAPEHFVGPAFVKQMVPKWMPGGAFWAYFVGCALIAAATALALRKFERLTARLLGLMFFLFVCLIYLPSTIRHPTAWQAWTIMFRDLTFCAGAWALAGSRRFGQYVLAVAALMFSAFYFLHPTLSPGVPSPLPTPALVPFGIVWTYLTAAILLVCGLALLLNLRPRHAAASVGVLMTVLTVFPYLVLVILALRRTDTEVNQWLNYVADTLLYAGAALAVAGAFSRAVASRSDSVSLSSNCENPVQEFAVDKHARVNQLRDPRFCPVN